MTCEKKMWSDLRVIYKINIFSCNGYGRVNLLSWTDIKTFGIPSIPVLHVSGHVIDLSIVVKLKLINDT